MAGPEPRRRAGGPASAWRTGGPVLGAVATVIVAWQLVVWSGWRPEYVLPGPGPVFGRVARDLAGGGLLAGLGVTLRRALLGYGAAVVVGGAAGAMVGRGRLVAATAGSLITGLQTMPSIAWFPLAILLFKLNEGAIMFVVVLGAAPAIANGFIAGLGHVPPLIVRAGRVLGARGLTAYRYVILPAALPSIVAGLKQGWAFAWRSLMAGELLVIVANRPSIGVRLQFARELSDAEGLLATMVVILVVGIAVDLLVFARVETAIRRRRGLIATRA